MKPIYAVAFVETPNGTDMIECTILKGQTVQFQLLSRHTSVVGKGRMQIIIRDVHNDGDEPCQSATPPFTYEVEELINDAQILTDENGNVIITDEAKPLFTTETFSTIDELEELKSLSHESYLIVSQQGKTYKVKVKMLR